MAQMYSRIARGGLTDSAVWTAAGGSPVTLDGYFDAHFMDALGVEAARPCWRGPASLLVGVKQRDVVTVGGVSYTVAEIAIDTPDPGETLLYLRKS